MLFLFKSMYIIFIYYIFNKYYILSNLQIWRKDMTIDLLFKIAIFIVLLGVGIKVFKFLSGVVFKLAIVMVVLLFFVQLIK